MIDMGVVSAVSQYAEEVLSKDGFRHVSAVVANCKMLAAEIEGQSEKKSNIDLNALILAGYLHANQLPAEQRESISLEALILYDADKLGRLSGLAIITSLIELGSRYPNRPVTGEVLAAVLRHIEERFVVLYQSLNTTPAREVAKTKFGYTLAFLDGVIEHLTDATPV